MTNRPRSQPTLRRGYSLVEVLVLMSIVSLVLGLAGGLLRRMLASDRQWARSLETARQIDRLSSRLRLDVHGGTLADGVPDELPAKLTLRESDNQRVIYAIADHRLTREVFDGETRLVRDSFTFPPGSRLRFEVTGSGATSTTAGKNTTIPRVRLTVTLSRQPAGQPELSQGAPPPRVVEIEATLGRVRAEASPTTGANAGGAP